MRIVARRLLALLVLVVALGLPSLAVADGIHHQLYIRLSPDQNRIDVMDLITVRRGGPNQFRLAPRFAVSSVIVDGQAVEFDRGSHVVDVDLGEVAIHTVEIRYRAALSDTDQATMGGHTLFVDRDGSYLPAGSGWIPRLDDSDVSFKLTVSAPDPHKAVATGRLIEDASADGSYTATFVEQRPGIGPSLFAGPYEIAERITGGIRLRTYFHPEIAGFADAYLTRAGDYLARFTAIFGEYPFSDFHIISAPTPVGHAFPGLTYIAKAIVPMPFMLGRSLSHEIAHNWLGNGILVDYASGNWSEGLTTYIADYALAGADGAEAQRAMRLSWLRDFAALPLDQDFPIRQFTSRTGDPSQIVGYNKTAFFFHMLERRIGEEAFAKGLRALWASRKFTVVDWKDLQAVFQEQTNSELAGFFQQWIDRAGAPRIELVSATCEKGDDGSTTIQILVRMTGADYALDVPVTIETEQGKVMTTLKVAGGTSTGAWSVDGKPDRVTLDPDYNIFRRLLPEEAPPILRDVTLNMASITVVAADEMETIEAARDLAQGLLGNSLRFMGLEGIRDPETPALVIGTQATIDAAIEEFGLSRVPPEISGQGTARVWTGRFANGRPYAVIAADTVDALNAIARPLSHYKRMSYVVFDGARMIGKGIWPLKSQPLARTLGPPA